MPILTISFVLFYLAMEQVIPIADVVKRHILGKWYLFVKKKTKLEPLYPNYSFLFIMIFSINAKDCKLSH